VPKSNVPLCAIALRAGGIGTFNERLDQLHFVDEFASGHFGHHYIGKEQRRDFPAFYAVTGAVDLEVSPDQLGCCVSQLAGISISRIRSPSAARSLRR
jgi:hypothetical protein